MQRGFENPYVLISDLSAVLVVGVQGIKLVLCSPIDAKKYGSHGQPIWEKQRFNRR